jgi:hypothetical protein
VARLARAGRQGHGVVAAFITTAFTRQDAEAARAQWRQVADKLHPKVLKLAALMDQVEHAVLACTGFSTAHRPKLHSTNPIERAIASTARLSDAPRSSASSPTKPPSPDSSAQSLLEQNNEWAVQRAGYMTLETMAPLSDDPMVKLPAVAA